MQRRRKRFGHHRGSGNTHWGYHNHGGHPAHEGDAHFHGHNHDMPLETKDNSPIKKQKTAIVGNNKDLVDIANKIKNKKCTRIGCRMKED